MVLIRVYFLPACINTFISHTSSNNTSGYTGVIYYNPTDKYNARTNPFRTSKSRHIGYYSTAEEASEAYQAVRAVECEKARDYMRSLGHYSEDIILKVV